MKNEVIYTCTETMPDIKQFSRYFVNKIALLYKMTVWKRGIIQPKFYRILPKVDQVIHTLETNCMPNIMILARMVFHIFKQLEKSPGKRR